MFTLCRTAGSFERYIHKVYMLTAYSAVVTAVSSTKCGKYTMLKNLLNKIHKTLAHTVLPRWEHREWPCLTTEFRVGHFNQCSSCYAIPHWQSSGRPLLSTREEWWLPSSVHLTGTASGLNHRNMYKQGQTHRCHKWMVIQITHLQLSSSGLSDKIQYCSQVWNTLPRPFSSTFE